MTTDPSNRIRRYPGASSFKDTEESRLVFFGREEEKRALLHQVMADDLVVVFGRSGHGKTSLISAGLMEPLRDHGYFPVVARVNATDRTPMQAVIDAVEKAGASHSEYEYEAGAPDSLREFFQTFEVWRGDTRQTPVLILDQFEELFTLQEDEPREAFLSEFIDLVRRATTKARGEDDRLGRRDPGPKVKVVLSLREDYLAELEVLDARLPVYGSLFRVGPLLREAARNAIESPCRDPDDRWESEPFEWTEAELKRVLDFLCRGSASVLPFQLQLLCHHAESLIIHEGIGPEIDPDELGDLNDVLSGFYEHTLEDAVEEVGESDAWPWSEWMRMKRLRRLCETGLIRAERRLSLDPDFIKDEFGVEEGQLKRLVDGRLLAVDARTGGSYYELSHDTLVEPILKSRQRRQDAARKKALPYAVGAAVVAALWGSTFLDNVRDDMLLTAAEEIIDAGGGIADQLEDPHQMVAALLNDVINFDDVPGPGEEGWGDGVQAYVNAVKASQAVVHTTARADNSASALAVAGQQAILGAGSNFASSDLSAWPEHRLEMRGDAETTTMLRTARGSMSGWVGLGFDQRGALFWRPPSDDSVRVGGHRVAVRGVDVSRDGQLAVSGDEGGALWLTDLSESVRAPVASANTGAIIWSVALHNERPLLASATRDGILQLWEWDEASAALAVLATDSTYEGGGINVSFLEFGGTEGDILVVGHRFRPSWLVDVSGDEFGERTELEGVIRQLGLSPDGTRLITMRNDSAVYLRDLTASGATVIDSVAHEGANIARWVAVMNQPDSSSNQPFAAATSRSDGTLRLWEADEGGRGLSGRYVELLDQGSLGHLVQRESDDVLVTGGPDGIMSVYDLEELAGQLGIEEALRSGAATTGGDEGDREAYLERVALLKEQWNALDHGCLDADRRGVLRGLELRAEDGDEHPALGLFFTPLDEWVRFTRVLRDWFAWLPLIEPDSLDLCANPEATGDSA